MNLILAALRRPYTVMVVVLAVSLASLAALRKAPVDIFPELDVPVIWVVQPYPGMMQQPPGMQPMPQPPMTAPRPGVVSPQQPQVPGNPYQPQPQPVRPPGGSGSSWPAS